MGDGTKIEWAGTKRPDGKLIKGASWNINTGCKKKSEECKNCYAEREWARLSANSKTRYFKRAFTNIALHPEELDQPLRWKRPRKIFVDSMSDLFHEEIPFDFISKAFDVMARAHWHTFIVLTKWPERMIEWLAEHKPADIPWPLPNVWVGVTAGNQDRANERIPLLAQIPAAVHFLSWEPALGPLNLRRIETFDGYFDSLTGQHYRVDAGGTEHPVPGPEWAKLDWVISGDESGAKSKVRPMELVWAIGVKNDCEATGTAFFMKQIIRDGHKLPIEDWPPELRVQESPPERQLLAA